MLNCLVTVYSDVSGPHSVRSLSNAKHALGSTIWYIVEPHHSASKNTDSSVFYTEIETKILNTDSDPKILIELE